MSRTGKRVKPTPSTDTFWHKTYVPDLEFDRFAIEFDRSDFEVNSNGADIAFGVCVISESQQETRLSDSRVADQK
jgi:hypothetical protein